MEKINYNEEVKSFFNFVGTTKLKRIQNLGTIISDNGSYNVYPSHFGFAFASDKFEQACKFVSCRDYLHDAIRTFINDKTRLPCDYHGYAHEENCPDMPIKNMKLLIQLQETPKTRYTVKRAATAVKVLNDFEEFCGIPITKAEEVVVTGFEERNKRKIRHILLKGDKMYMQNPHMLSMVTLIMRFCSSSAYGWYRRPANLANWLETKNANARDKQLLKQCFKTLPIIIKFRKGVFEGVSLKELFPTNINFDFHSKGGVASLCNANTPNKTVNQRVLVMERKIKKSIKTVNNVPFYKKIARNFFSK